MGLASPGTSARMLIQQVSQTSVNQLAHSYLCSLLVLGFSFSRVGGGMFVGVVDCRVVVVLRSVGKSGVGIEVTATRSRSGKAGRMFGPRSVSSTR